MTAAVYFEQSELWGKQPEPYQAQVLADMLDILPSDVSSVLDVGCGDGLITNALPLSVKVVGLDPSEHALEHVRRETRCGSITELPFEDRSFDLVMTTDVLEHLPPDVLARAVQQLTRVARRYVLVCVPHREQFRANFTRCARCGHTYHINHHQRSWAEHDLVRGLMPAHWRALEVRYTGLFRPHDDPSVELRHRLDLWNAWDGAVCTACGSKGQCDPSPRQERLHRYMDCLAANQWWSRALSPFSFTDRSEIMVLYSCEPRRPRLYQPTLPRIVQAPLQALDFTNPLQRVQGSTICPLWPTYQGGAEQIRCSQGVRLLRRDFSASELPIRFPAEPVPGDELILEVSALDAAAEIKLFAWDHLNDKRVPLETRCVARGRHSLQFVLTDAVRNCHADRYGFLALFTVVGNIVAHRVELRPGGGRPSPTLPWVLLAPGHQVYCVRGPDYDRSWGFIALEGGRLPMPCELSDPVPAPPPRASPESDLLEGLDRSAPHPARKRADNLFFLIEQACAAQGDDAPAAPAGVQLVHSYRNVVTHRGKRVLVLSHLYPCPAQPGLGPFVHEQVSALRVNSGIDARVVCCTPFWFNTFNPAKVARAYRVYRKQFRSLHWESHDGVPVLYLPYMVGGFFRHWLHWATYGNAIMDASDWLRDQFPFDIIHAHTSYLDGTAALALSRKFDVPFLLTEHTGPFHLLTDNPLMRHKTVASLTAAQRVFCVSGALAADVCGVLEPAQHKKIEVLHNGVDSALFYPPPHWQPDPRAPRFLSVISLDDNKNPHLLLDAFARLLADVPDAHLDIVGQGPLKDEIAARIRKENLSHAISMLGVKTRSEVARLMRDDCDALVLPSNSETFGVVLIEALACGKPVISTDCGGPRDIVTDPSVGMLCLPRDDRSLHQALVQLARNLGSYRSDDIRRHALAKYDYFNLASRLADEYDRLTG
jgi:glycosyltransferase involved in cell wall biosynthesis/SAM-dependent methyltransferase